MIQAKYPIALSSVFLWIGFVCAISFMEAWLKFRAPGITISLGLGIGKLVFDALNKMEWIFVIGILSNFLFLKEELLSLKNVPFFIAVVLLIAQTFWLLPTLDARADLHIQGATVPPSNLHFYYVGMEIVKVVSLFVFGIRLFKHPIKNYSYAKKL